MSVAGSKGSLSGVVVVMALHISTDRLLGLLAYTMEEFDQAQSHF